MKRISKKQWEQFQALLMGPLPELVNLLTDWQTDAKEYHDGRSEKWQESDAGSNYSEWCSTLEQLQSDADQLVSALNDLQQEPEGT